MTEAAQSDILAGIYRRVGKTNELLAMLGSALARAGIIPPSPASAPAAAPLRVAIPEQGELPLAGAVLAAKPRAWGNSVKVYEWLWKRYEEDGFTTDCMAKDAANLPFDEALPVSVPTALRVLSALVSAGAAKRTEGRYWLRKPTDELREAVERVRNTKGGAK